MMHGWRSFGAVVVGATLLAAPTLSAQGVTNGGFESGNTGWTFNANDCGSANGDANTAPAYTGSTTSSGTYATPRSGSSDMWFGAAGCTPSISQSITTVAGQGYTLDFWTKVNGSLNNTPNQFTVMFNGTTLFDGQLSNTAWQNMSFAVTGTGTDQITFAGNNTNGGTELDDVSITTTPEPASIALLGTGLVGLVPMVRRKRR